MILCTHGCNFVQESTSEGFWWWTLFQWKHDCHPKQLFFLKMERITFFLLYQWSNASDRMFWPAENFHLWITSSFTVSYHKSFLLSLKFVYYPPRVWGLQKTLLYELSILPLNFKVMFTVPTVSLTLCIRFHLFRICENVHRTLFLNLLCNDWGFPWGLTPLQKISFLITKRINRIWKAREMKQSSKEKAA